MKWLQALLWVGVFVGMALQPIQAAEAPRVTGQAAPVLGQDQASETTPSIVETQESDFPEDSGTEAEFGEKSVDFTWLFLKTIFAMVVVIALAVIGLRFLLPRLTFNRQIKGGTDFKIVNRLPIDAKKALYIVEIEGKRLLIAASEHYVGLVTELKGHDGESAR